MSDHRFFCILDDAAYEQTRLSLDATWGLVAPETCVEPAATAPRDASGQIILGVNREFLAFPAVADTMPQLLASGVVVEITEGDYMTATHEEIP